MGQSAGAIRAGGAYVELHGKDDGLKSTLKGNESSFGKWGDRISSIGSSVGQKFAKGLQVIQTVSVATAGAAIAVVGGFVHATKTFEENAERLSRLPKTGINQEDLKNARALRLAMSTLSTSITAAWSQIGAAVAPILTKVLNWVSKIVQGFTKWAGANRPLIAGIATMAVRVAAWSAGIFVAVKALMAVGAIVAFLAANPLVALVAALAAGVAAWLSFTSSGQAAFGGIKSYVGSVVAWLQERFGALYKDFQTAWAGIVAAVSKGDLSTAAEIVWLTLKLAFFETVKALGGNWNKFYTGYIQTVALIGDAWDFLFTRITQGFDTAFTKLKQGWRGTQTFLAKGISYILGVMEGKSAKERQEVFDTLDEMQSEETKQSNKGLDARNKAAEAKMHESLEKRRKALEKELDSLPANDQTRIDQLRKRLQSLAVEAKEGSPDKPQFYAPRNIATAGTFNAAAIRGVAGGAAIDKIAKNTEDTAKNTKATTTAISKMRGPTFGGGSR